MQMAYGNGESGDGDWGTLSMITLGMCNDTGWPTRLPTGKRRAWHKTKLLETGRKHKWSPGNLDLRDRRNHVFRTNLAPRAHSAGQPPSSVRNVWRWCKYYLSYINLIGLVIGIGLRLLERRCTSHTKGNKDVKGTGNQAGLAEEAMNNMGTLEVISGNPVQDGSLSS